MIGMGVIKSAAAPYLRWIVLGAIAAAGALGAYQGQRIGSEHQKVANQAAVDRLNKVIEGKSTALRDAAGALRAASGSINAINTEAEHRIAVIAADRKRAEAARDVAQAAEQQLRDSLAARAAGLAHARRVGSDRCKALLDLDVSQLAECLP